MVVNEGSFLTRKVFGQPVSERTLDYLREKNKIASLKVGNRVLFSMESLRTFVQANDAGTSTDT